VTRTFLVGQTEIAARPLEPALYLVATPIGNLGDITLRAVATLATADVIYAEDTRHTRTLLAHFSIRRPLRSHHEHSSEDELGAPLADLAAGRSVALVSDAGMPLVSDPGYRLALAAIEHGHSVTVVPGPSSALAALAVAGLPTDRFLFAGFLPVRHGERISRIEELKGVPATLVLFEAPGRVAATLADLHTVLGARPAALARELTKKFEEVRRGTLESLASELAVKPPQGEIVLLVGPPQTCAVTDQTILTALQDQLGDRSLRDAADNVARALGVARRRVYDLGLALRRGLRGAP